jgi:hypothetical protein
MRRLQTPVLITCSYVDGDGNIKYFYTLINFFYIILLI